MLKGEEAAGFNFGEALFEGQELLNLPPLSGVTEISQVEALVPGILEAGEPRQGLGDGFALGTLGRQRRLLVQEIDMDSFQNRSRFLLAQREPDLAAQRVDPATRVASSAHLRSMASDSFSRPVDIAPRRKPRVNGRPVAMESAFLVRPIHVCHREPTARSR